MATFLVEKKISLGYLGEQYKDSYIIYSAIPFKDYEIIMTNAEKIGDDNIASIKFMQNVLTEHFISGNFQGKDLTKDDVLDFDGETIINSFKLIAGEPDPKVEQPLTSTSPTVETPQETS